VSLVPYVHLDTDLSVARDGALVGLSKAELHHLSTVLRLRPGAALEVADGDGWWAPAELADAAVRLRDGPRHLAADRPSLTVAQALAKGRKLDEVVRQLTELGVDRVLPVDAARSVTRLTGAKAEQVLERWRAVGRAAAEQARRPRRPLIAAITTPAALAARTVPGEVLLVAEPGGTPLPEVLEAARGADAVTIAVGPEGGWTAAELQTFAAAGAWTVGLGTSVLRTEHAAAAALAVLAAGLGRWSPSR
jgi:16S rRNA (uracil1498-N3)-methyltransferase